MPAKLHSKAVNRSGLKTKSKCSKCKVVPCVNFYRKGERDFEGGELYVLENLIEKNVVLPCNVGSVIYTLCQLWSNIGDAFPSDVIFYQCIRDLRASAYLLLSCHYRSSIQLLRPIVENYVAGIYWDAKFMLPNQGNVEQSFNDFLDDKYKIPKDDWREVCSEKRPQKLLGYVFCLEWLKKKGVHVIVESEISELMGKFNKYLHPSFGAYEIGKDNCPGCSSFVKYEKSEYEQCLSLYQDVTALMLEILFEYTKTFFSEDAKSAEQIIIQKIPYLIDLKLVEKEVGTTLVFSKKLRAFLSRKEFR